MKQLVWDWARLVNQQVPYLTYATKVYQFPHSSMTSFVTARISPCVRSSPVTSHPRSRAVARAESNTRS